MKKTISVIMFVCIVCLCACSGKQKKQEQTSSAGVDSTEILTEKTAPEKKDVVYDWEAWVIKTGVVNDAGKTQFFHISFPTGMGYSAPYGSTLNANDGTFVLLGRQVDDTHPCAGVEDAFEAFKPQMISTTEDNINDLSCSDFDFTVLSKKLTNVNGFPACRFEGTHSYSKLDADISQYFVGYTAQLSNGGYVYWLVLDSSADQSLKEVVAYDADTMATTIGED